jgi:Tol biopolymer transport system component
VRADGTAVTLLPLSVRAGGYRFLRDGKRVVYMPRRQSVDFWLFDVATRNTRQITRFRDTAQVATFDLTPDGGHIVFDRSREKSDIVLIELPD